jgi:hypothetical protein
MTYPNAKWIEYKEGAALLMAVVGDSRSGMSPAIIAIVASKDFRCVDVDPPLVELSERATAYDSA